MQIMDGDGWILKLKQEKEMKQEFKQSDNKEKFKLKLQDHFQIEGRQVTRQETAVYKKCGLFESIAMTFSMR